MPPADPALAAAVDGIAGRSGFSGVVRVDGDRGCRLVRAYGMADRRHGIANTEQTRFGIASGAPRD